MDGYHVALFVHFCALIGAIATAAVVHLATGRRDRSTTVGEQLEWHSIVMSAAKFFPIALVTLVLSGSFMIGRGGVVWSTGFVVAGLTGVVLLFAIGMTLSMRGRALKVRLTQIVKDTGANQPAVMARDAVAETLQNMPVGIVLAVMFDMTTKPAVGSAVALIGAGALVGGMVGVVRRAVPAANSAPTEA